MPTPVGQALLLGDEHGLTGLYLESQRTAPARIDGFRRDDRLFTEARDQLAGYFEGGRTRFSLRLAPAGTPFQQAVWAALVEVPFGETTSYGELAARIGHPSAARAVGAANGRNPIAVVVPCHRVIGRDGSLTGYAGGLPRKQWLLEHEARYLRPAATG